MTNDEWDRWASGRVMREDGIGGVETRRGAGRGCVASGAWVTPPGPPILGGRGVGGPVVSPECP